MVRATHSHTDFFSVEFTNNVNLAAAIIVGEIGQRRNCSVDNHLSSLDYHDGTAYFHGYGDDDCLQFFADRALEILNYERTVRSFCHWHRAKCV
jgi:hypothetical protein